MIDRLSPTRRPDRPRVMWQVWRSLLFLHWAVPASMIARLLPKGLEVDTFEGEAYVGLIPFTMNGIRQRYLPPLPGLSSFHEVNVRTYVHCQGRDPGVWFFSLDANSALAVWGARTFWSLPYFRATMSLDRPGGTGGAIDYESRRVGSGVRTPGCRLRYRPIGVPGPALPGTLDHFLVERYILYKEVDGGLDLGRVHHEPYPVQSAEVTGLEENLIAAAGIERPDCPPLVHFAEGVRVEIFAPERVGRTAGSVVS